MKRALYVFSAIVAMFLAFVLPAYVYAQTNAAPTITGVTPSSGYKTGGDSVTITGTNFDATSTVKFGTNTAAGTWVDATTILATAPAGYAGPTDISVTNTDGQTAIAVNAFTYLETAPIITSISPQIGPANGGNTVTINGANFSNGSKEVTALSTGFSTVGGSTCGIYEASSVYCWGYNGYGQIGDNSKTTRSAPTPLYMYGVLNGKRIHNLTSATDTVCAIASDMKVYCWGKNNSGQLGNNSTTDSSIPVAVDMSGAMAGKSVSKIDAGDRFTCALTTDSILYCWGLNNLGQLGNNTTTSSSTPVAVDMSGELSGKTVVDLSAGAAHACVLTSEGRSYCWGSGASGRLGTGSTASSNVPISVQTTGVLAGKHLTSISVGDQHTCVIASDGSAYCWGRGSSGQLGNNSTTATVSSPAAVNTSLIEGKTFVSIAAGFEHTCAILSDQQVYCWGSDTAGALGNGSASSSATRVPGPIDTSGVLNGKTVRSITSGYQRSCVIASDGQAYCWGSNGYGLGDGTTTTKTSPVAVAQVGSSLPTVTFGENPSTSVTFTSSAILRAVAPAHAADTVDVSVQNYDNQTATSSNAYEYVAAPTISKISPTSGLISGGTEVTINGTNFYEGLDVAIGGDPLTNISVINSTTITGVTASSSSPGAKDVTISDDYDQTATLEGAYTYRLPNPTITSVTPAAASYNSGATITIKGSNFVDWGNGTSWYTVNFGSGTGSNVKFIDPFTLTVTLPNIAPKGVDVTISSNYSESATLINGFTILMAEYRFNNAPLNIAATQPGKLTILSLNASGNAWTSSSDTLIQLTSSSSTGKFATDLGEDESTRWNHDSVTLPAGQSSVDVWYKDNTVGTPTITGSIADGAMTFQQQQTVTSPYRLQVSGVSDPIVSGVPSSVTVRAVDYSGAPRSDYIGTFSFGSTDSTASLPASYTMTAADRGIKTFTNGVTLKTPGEFCVSATDTSDSLITGSQCNISVRTPNSGTIDRLAFITEPQYIPANISSAPITIQTQDANGVPIPVSVDTPVYLSANSSTISYSVEGTTWSGGSAFTATIPAGSTSLNLFIKDSSTRTTTIAARDLSTDTSESDSGWNNAAHTIVTGVGPAEQVSIDGPDTLLVGEQGEYIIFLRDAEGNRVTALQDTEVTVSADTNTAQWELTDGTTASAEVNIVIPQGSTQVALKLSDTTPSVGAAMTTLRATSSSGLDEAIIEVQILSAALASASLTPEQSTLDAGDITSVTLQVFDSNGDETYLSATKTFSLRTTSTSGQYSLTADPFSPVSSVTLQRAEGTKTVYYRDTTAGVKNLSIQSANVTSDSTPITIEPTATYRLGLVPNTASAQLGKASSAFTVTTYDVYGNVALQDTPLTVFIHSDQEAADFATTATGPWDVTAVTIPQGQSTAQFYAKSDSFFDAPANITIGDESSASSPDTGIINDQSTLRIIGQTVESVSFVTTPQTVIAGQVTQAITVTLQQGDGTPAIQDGTTNVNVSVNEGKIIQTQNSSDSHAPSVPVAKGESSATFYYVGEKAGSYDLSARHGVPSATQSVTVTADEPDHFDFISAPQTLPTHQPSDQIVIQLQDAFGNPTSYDDEMAVSLASTCDNDSFSETNTPWTSVDSLTLAPETSNLAFYYTGASAGTCTISVTANGLSTATQVMTLTENSVIKLAIRGPTELIAGADGIFSVDLTDMSGNIVPADSPIDVALQTTSSTGELSTTELHFNIGDTTRTFRYADTTTGSETLRVTDENDLLASATHDIEIVKGEVSAVRLSPTASTARAGEKTVLTATLTNEYGVTIPTTTNREVALQSNQVTGVFTQNDIAVTSLSFTSGQTSQNFSYTQTSIGAGRITATGDGLDSNASTVTILAADVAGIVFLNSAYEDEDSLEIGQTGHYRVGLIDQYGNPTTSTNPITLYAHSTGPGALSGSGSFTINANDASGNFTYTQTSTGTFTLSVSDSPTGQNSTLGAITQDGDVIYGAPAHVRFAPSTVSLERGAVTDALEIEIVNSNGLSVPAQGNDQELTLDMSEGTGIFSTTPNGTFTSSLNMTIPEGERSTTFYYRNDDAQIETRRCITNALGRSCETTDVHSHQIRARSVFAGDSRSKTLPVTMQYGDPVQLAFITPPRQQQAERATGLITVQRQNRYGKAVPLHENTQVAIDTTAVNTGSIGSSKTTWNVQQVTILDSESTVSFYYKDSEVGQPLLTAASVSGAPLQSAQQIVTITAPSSPPPPATDFIVTNISDPQAAGTPSSVIVIAIDADGFVVDSYGGTISFSSDDSTAMLPENYTFNPATDKGAKTFTNQVAFRTPGEKSVTVTDTNGLTGSQVDITVLGANTNPVRAIAFAAPPSPMALNVDELSPAITIELLDANGDRTVAPVGGLPIRLTTSNSNGVFLSQPAGDGSAEFVMTVPEGLSFATAYYKAASTSNHTVSVSDWMNGIDQTLITNDTLAVTMNADEPEGETPVTPPIIPDREVPQRPTPSTTLPTTPGLVVPTEGDQSDIPPQQPSNDGQGPSGTNSPSPDDAAVEAVSAPIATAVTLGALVIILPLIYESIRHVRFIHQLQGMIRQRHVSTGLIKAQPVLRPVTHTPYTSVFFWLPIAASLALSIAATTLARQTFDGEAIQPVALIVTFVSLITGVAAFIAIHTNYLSHMKTALQKILQLRS